VTIVTGGPDPTDGDEDGTASPPDDDSPAGWRGKASRVVSTLEPSVAVAGGILGLVSVPVWAFELFDDDSPAWLTASYVCLTGAFFIAAAVWLQFRLRDVIRQRNQARAQRDRALERRGIRARRLASAQPTFAQAFEHLSAAALVISQGGDEKESIREQGRSAAHRVAEVFTALTNVPCRATVKEVFYPTGETRLAVRDVFRSHPAALLPPGHVDFVEDNTHFEEILVQGATSWMCNDIPAEYQRRYKNSHITAEQAARDDFPYRSTLVVRIAAPGGGAPPDLAGFVCVDSLERGIFRANFDVSPLLAVAHGMYSTLTWYQQVAAEQMTDMGEGDSPIEGV
jgi:hypothetical protein